jgi:8-oxo-dGTP diphosphatase
MPFKSFPFNVRVYGIFLEKKKILVSDEYIFGKNITKFPGGGLHFGEGPADCIRREMQEETGLQFDVTGHFYTTDFFQESAFHPGQQVISIYYLVTTLHSRQLRVSEKKFDFGELKDGAQSLRWITAAELTADTFTLPIDRVVGDLLKERLPHTVWKA